MVFLVLVVFGLFRDGLSNFFRTYLATLSLKKLKNMNHHEFSAVCIKKKQLQKNKKNK